MFIFDPSRLKGTYIDDGGSVSGAGVSGSDGGGASTTDPVDSNISVGEGQEKFTGRAPDTDDGGSAQPAQEKQKPAQTPEQDKAFAELRRRTEAAERKLQQYNQTVQQHFGQTHGLNDLDSYFNAVGNSLQQQQQARQQQVDQYRTGREAELEKAGYDLKAIREIMRTDPAFVQMNQENQALKRQVASDQQQRQQAARAQGIMSDHKKLKDRYGDLVPALDAMDEGTISLMRQGIPLRAAWLQANEDAILEHAKTTTKAKTLRDVGSKNHLDTEKGGGGEFEAQIDISDEKLKVYKSLFPGKKMADYKKMESKYKAAAKK
jgi:hypothetical protein